jgi:hypothetical protein
MSSRSILQLMRKKKLLQEMTKLEAEKESRKRAELEADEIDTLGQDSEIKAAKSVIEKQKEVDHQESEERAVSEWKLTDAKNKVWTYNDSLIQEAIRMILLSDVPAGYRLAPRITKKGLAFWIRDKEGNWYIDGMKISGLPKYDLNCLDRKIGKALDFIDKLEEKYGTTNQPTIITS